MEILSVKNLSFTYPKCDKEALKNINMTVNSGDIVLLCGETGSGKTTLLRLMKGETAPYGNQTGEVLFSGKDTRQAKSSDIGFVFQDPDSQIVCDKVWHELSFALENTGTQPGQMKRRIAEISSYFGITQWFHKNTYELSGGQKQLLNLAGVTVMAPRLILLDEPLSQLDPIACVEFVNTVKRLNDDFGITFIISEHRTQEIAPVANKIALMRDGKLVAFGDTEMVLPEITNEAVFGNFPDCAKIWKDTGMKGDCPLTVKDGKNYLSDRLKLVGKYEADIKYPELCDEKSVECKNISFRYSKNDDDILKNLNFSCYKGEVHSILGANAAGKTTLVKLISGVLKAYTGKIILPKGSKTVLMVQNVRDMFTCESVYEELMLECRTMGIEEERLQKILKKLGLSELSDRHPFDLSGGELQKCAMAKLLLTQPDIILMDEPVKSLDCVAKDEIKKIIRELSDRGITVIIVTHDTEFAAEVSDRCSLLFDGEMVACDIPQIFFSNNSFYTTGASRMSREYIKNAVTCNQVSELLKKREN